MPIRVVLAEDNALLRQGLTRLIALDEGLELVGTATDMPSLLELVAREKPDVVVSDIRMPPTGTDEGIQVAATLRAEQPQTGVVLLSQHADAAYALRLLEGGSSGRAYLLKERVADVGELTAAVRAVASGGSVIDPTVVERLVTASRAPEKSPLHTLTPRELEVLGEMAQGKSNASIAASLVLSERAIEKHTNSIFSKLGLTEERDLNRRVSAVLVYLGGVPSRASGR
ncbi:response regulator transcription factor [Motilibacter aurantiacus]|uniref:response regulator transcription factor n=1 Tax=Motilibacter aurantiacus TaxID=2714955 RepID=UPI0014079259|nr:response regulator transcription factor [Motilibacter aurantiacus]NHC46605.1 response regulator transcription factor [Motilibacter aurantiacus]